MKHISYVISLNLLIDDLQLNYNKSVYIKDLKTVLCDLFKKKAFYIYSDCYDYMTSYLYYTNDYVALRGIVSVHNIPDNSSTVLIMNLKQFLEVYNLL